MTKRKKNRYDVNADPVEEFFANVVDRAERSMQDGQLIIGAYAKALNEEIEEYRAMKRGFAH